MTKMNFQSGLQSCGKQFYIGHYYMPMLMNVPVKRYPNHRPYCFLRNDGSTFNPEQNRSSSPNHVPPYLVRETTHQEQQVHSVS